jgi:hypothetical protein
MPMRVGLRLVKRDVRRFSDVAFIGKILFIGGSGFVDHAVNKSDQHDNTNEDDKIGSKKSHDEHKRIIKPVGRPKNMNAEVYKETGNKGA